MLRLSGSRLPGRPPERSARDRPAEPARVCEDEDERHAETHRKSKQVEAPFGPDHEESEGRDEDEGCGQPSLTDEGGGERGNDREQEREAGAHEEPAKDERADAMDLDSIAEFLRMARRKERVHLVASGPSQWIEVADVLHRVGYPSRGFACLLRALVLQRESKVGIFPEVDSSPRVEEFLAIAAHLLEELSADEEVRGQVVEVIRVGAPRRPAVGTDRGALQHIDRGLSLPTGRRAHQPG